jgi:hypothetical protein
LIRHLVAAGDDAEHRSSPRGPSVACSSASMLTAVVVLAMASRQPASRASSSGAPMPGRSGTAPSATKEL